ncbi:MAG: ASKHA domain-containing protein [bacterium]
MKPAMCHITVSPDGRSIEVPKGSNLLSGLLDAGIEISASCGGQGTCGKCKVIIESGEYNAGVTPFLNKKEVAKGYALACLTLVEGDLSITIPPASRAEGKRIIIGEAETIINERWGIGAWDINPRTKSYDLSLSPPSLEDNRSDLDRIASALVAQGCCEKARFINCPLPLLGKLARQLREGEWKVTATVMELSSEIEIIDIQPGRSDLHHYGLAIDVGTTTVVCHLIDLLEGRIVASAADYNAQINFGEDIISRIIYARSKTGLDKLQKMAIATINRLIDQIIRSEDISPDRIDNVIAVGNTTMMHLLLGINPRYIRQEPYIPTFSAIPHYMKASEIGLQVNKNAYMGGLPSIAGFVGSDITAGILATGIYHLSELSVFIDIGTNGEIVVGNKDWLVAASCSAGPAFEGGEVKFGMRASSGAIDSVKIYPDTLEPAIGVIQKMRPRGICGSGILDCLAEMFLSGIVDRKGKIRHELSHPRIRKGEDGWEYVIAWEGETAIGKDICMTEVDIDNIIRAKGAVFAAIRVLLQEIGYSVDQVDRFMIAGGFGHCLNIEHAITIGLLPDLPLERFRFLGNSAIIGAYLSLISEDLKREIHQVAKGVTYVELSTSRDFMDEYVSALFLPHTDHTLFPGVIPRMNTVHRGSA